VVFIVRFETFVSRKKSGFPGAVGAKQQTFQCVVQVARCSKVFPYIRLSHQQHATVATRITVRSVRPFVVRMSCGTIHSVPAEGANTLGVFCVL
uniref:Uncharacterized protein n=1 Tax=Anopheles arabiensis TaxID=7173 RepID=A0A182IHT7_ANOAR